MDWLQIYSLCLVILLAIVLGVGLSSCEGTLKYILFHTALFMPFIGRVYGWW